MGKIIHVDFQTKEYGDACSCCGNVGVELVEDLCWDCTAEIAFDLEAIPLDDNYKRQIEELVKDIDIGGMDEFL